MIQQIRQYTDALVKGTVSYVDDNGETQPYTGDCLLFAAPVGADPLSIVPVAAVAIGGAVSTKVYVPISGYWAYEFRAPSPIRGSGGGKFYVKPSPFPAPTT